MGSKWEVSVWKVKLDDKDEEEWGEESIYQGDSLLKAVILMWKQRHMVRCIKLEWRPAEDYNLFN